MRWTKEELLRNPESIEFDTDIEIDDSAFDMTDLINGVEDLHVDGRGWLDDDNERFYVNIHITGVMFCPDAITNEEIEVPFETESEETYVFGQSDNEEERIVEDDVVDLLSAVIADILMEAPLQVSDVDEDEYPEGDGWKVYSEAEYQRLQSEKTDPRLAILKEFKEEE